MPTPPSISTVRTTQKIESPEPLDVGWLGPPTIEVVVLDVVDMLVRDTVLVVKVVEAAPPDTGG